MRKFFPFFVALVFSVAAGAADIYKFDPSHSSVSWSANHFGFSNPSGKFTDMDGTIIIDEYNPQNSSVDVTIRIASLSTGLPKFDSHLKSADFLDADKYPTAKFVSTSVLPSGRDAAKVSGKLTLHGVTKPITLDVKLNKSGIGPITQRKTVGFSASAVIKRSEFDMIFGLPGISDSVTIQIEAEGIFATSDNDSGLSKLNQAKAGSWKIVPSRSKIEFSAMQQGANISGSFKKFDAVINFDPAQLQSSNVEIVIDTTSVDISFAEAIDMIQDASWLATKSFPKAIYKSDHFTPLAEKKSFRSKGNLTLKGKTVPVDLNFVLIEYSKTSAHAIGTARIKRSVFGVGERDPKKANGVQDEVLIRVDVYAEKMS